MATPTNTLYGSLCSLSVSLSSCWNNSCWSSNPEWERLEEQLGTALRLLESAPAGGGGAQRLTAQQGASAAVSPSLWGQLRELAHCSRPLQLMQIPAGEGLQQRQRQQRLCTLLLRVQLAAAGQLLQPLTDPHQQLSTLRAVVGLVATQSEGLQPTVLTQALRLLAAPGASPALAELVAANAQLVGELVRAGVGCMRALDADRIAGAEPGAAAVSAAAQFLASMVHIWKHGDPGQGEACAEDLRLIMATTNSWAALASSHQLVAPLEATCCEDWLSVACPALEIVTLVHTVETMPQGGRVAAPALTPGKAPAQALASAALHVAADLRRELLAWGVDLASATLRHVCALGRKLSTGRVLTERSEWQPEAMRRGAAACLDAALAMLEALPLWEGALREAALAGGESTGAEVCRRPVRRCARQVLMLAAYGLFAKLDGSPQADAAKLARLAQGVVRVREEIQAATIPRGDADVPSLCELVFWRFCPSISQQGGGAGGACRDPNLSARLQKRLQQRQQQQAGGGGGPGADQAEASRREAEAAAAAEALLREEEAAVATVAAKLGSNSPSKAAKKRAKKHKQQRQQVQEGGQQAAKVEKAADRAHQEKDGSDTAGICSATAPVFRLHVSCMGPEVEQLDPAAAAPAMLPTRQSDGVASPSTRPGAAGTQHSPAGVPLQQAAAAAPAAQYAPQACGPSAGSSKAPCGPRAATPVPASTAPQARGSGHSHGQPPQAWGSQCLDGARGGRACGDDDGCVVCMEGGKDTVLVPCGHQALCVPCTAGMFGEGAAGCRGRCPVCMAEVQQFVRVFRV